MPKETIEFFKELKNNRPNLTAQQYKTIKGDLPLRGRCHEVTEGLTDRPSN